MQTYSQDISDALQQHGHCLLPDIGLLHLIRNVAKRSYQENKLYPPSFAVMLNPLHRPDPALYSVTRQIAFSHSLSDEEAAKKWSETAAAIREKLSTGSSVELQGLGYLNLNEKGHISFMASHESFSLYQPVAGGQEKAAETAPAEAAATEAALPVPAPAEEIEASAVAGPAATVFEEPRTRPSRARWWIAGSIVVLLLTGWFTYRGTIMRKKKATVIRHIIRKEKTTKGLASIDSLKLREDTDSLARQPAVDSVHYDIIFAIYNSRERAEHQFRKMRGWGHPVVLVSRDSSLYELGLPFTSVPADTAENLKKMKTLYGDRVHIEYGDR